MQLGILALLTGHLRQDLLLNLWYVTCCSSGLLDTVRSNSLISSAPQSGSSSGSSEWLSFLQSFHSWGCKLWSIGLPTWLTGHVSSWDEHLWAPWMDPQPTWFDKPPVNNDVERVPPFWLNALCALLRLCQKTRRFPPQKLLFVTKCWMTCSLLMLLQMILRDTCASLVLTSKFFRAMLLLMKDGTTQSQCYSCRKICIDCLLSWFFSFQIQREGGNKTFETCARMSTTDSGRFIPRLCQSFRRSDGLLFLRPLASFTGLSYCHPDRHGFFIMLLLGREKVRIACQKRALTIWEIIVLLGWSI